jgi:hypothetical protein
MCTENEDIETLGYLGAAFPVIDAYPQDLAASANFFSLNRRQYVIGRMQANETAKNERNIKMRA